MILITIDDQELYVSENASFTFIRENPFTEKAGDYTYNIDVDLSNKNNAQLYSGYKRHHGRYPQPNRTIRIYDRTRLICQGKEVILSVEDNVAKIQLVGNLSELNYQFNDNQKIRMLSLGNVSTKTPSRAADAALSFYPYVNETYPVILKYDSGVEQFVTDEVDRYNLSTNEYDVVFNSNTDLLPQPYLLAMVYKVLGALGYSVGRNDIDEDKYKRLVIIQNYHTTEYSKMLPNWTVREFIDEIEKFFNVIFDFHSDTHQCDIISVGSFYSQRASTVEIPEIIESHSVNLQDPSTFQTEYNNVGYQLGTDGFWKYQHIDQDILATSEHINQSWRWTTDSGILNDRKIFSDSSMGVQYVYRQDTAGIAPIIVNEFADYATDDLAHRNVLRIRPAKICYHYYVTPSGTVIYSAPVLTVRENERKKFFDVLTEGEEEYMSEVMDVAFYFSNVLMFDNNGGRDISGRRKCQCNVTYWMQMNNIPNHFDDRDDPNYDQTYTLKLTGQYGRAEVEFSNNVSLDTSRVFTFKFLSNDIFDPRSKFLICNRLFYCRKLQYTVLHGGLSRIVEGEFYPAT